MNKYNKNRLFEMMNRVNKINLNESYYSNTNQIDSNSDVFQNIYIGIKNLHEVSTENIIGEYTLTFNNMEVIDATRYNGTGINSNIIISFNEIEVIDNNSDETFVFEPNTEKSLIDYINNNNKWTQSIYEQAEEYVSGRNDNINEDIISGGIGDDKKISDFDPEQIKKGLDVEKEHTDNPEVAAEIAIDHLSEVPNYYGDEGSDPECCAQCNAANDVEKNNPDLYPEGWKEMDGIFMNPNKNMGLQKDELVDVLLGYKPLNVGDYVKQQ